MKRLINKLFIEDTKSAFIQLLRYSFVGGIAAAANFFFLFLFTDICRIYYLISNVLSFIIGLTVNYVLCKKFVFLVKTGNGKIEFLIYGVIGLVGLLFDTGLMYFFTETIHFYYMFSKVISTVIVLLWNFSARKVLYMIIEYKQQRK
ncbi:MAG: GtrA family protein [Bacteroidales bacterium]|jgi:putative flippase GtrA|nr:GtrA family protein [Bacteroidales bacterium]